MRGATGPRSYTVGSQNPPFIRWRIRAVFQAGAWKNSERCEGQWGKERDWERSPPFPIVTTYPSLPATRFPIPIINPPSHHRYRSSTRPSITAIDPVSHYINSRELGTLSLQIRAVFQTVHTLVEKCKSLCITTPNDIKFSIVDRGIQGDYQRAYSVKFNSVVVEK